MSATRREIIKLGACAFLLPLAAVADAATGPGAGPTLRATAIVLPELPGAAAFGRALQQAGVSCLPEAALFEIGRLPPPWRDKPLLGYASNVGEFIIEQLSFDGHYRSVFRGYHEFHDDHQIHRLTGAGTLVREIAARMATRGAEWTVVLADGFAHSPTPEGDYCETRVTTRLPMPATYGRFASSWYLIPHDRNL
jgi:hypothetical protein